MMTMRQKFREWCFEGCHRPHRQMHSLATWMSVVPLASSSYAQRQFRSGKFNNLSMQFSQSMWKKCLCLGGQEGCNSEPILFFHSWLSTKCESSNFTRCGPPHLLSSTNQLGILYHLQHPCLHSCSMWIICAYGEDPLMSPHSYLTQSNIHITKHTKDKGSKSDFKDYRWITF